MGEKEKTIFGRGWINNSTLTMETIMIYDGKTGDEGEYIAVVFRDEHQTIETKRFFFDKHDRSNALAKCLHQIVVFLDSSVC